MTADEIKALIVDALPGAEVVIDDLAGDGNHYHAKVIAAAFDDDRIYSIQWAVGP